MPTDASSFSASAGSCFHQPMAEAGIDRVARRQLRRVDALSGQCVDQLRR